MKDRAVLDHFDADSVARIVTEPSFLAKASGRATAFVGEKITQLIPPEVIDVADGLTSNFLLSEEWEHPDPKVYEFPHVLSVISNADAVHSRSLRLIFLEGSIATSAISLAGVGGPMASLAVALVEMPVNYTLVLKRSFEIQKSFHLRPTVERTNRAFSIATALSRQQRYEACFGERTTMIEGMFGRKLMAQPGRTIYASIKDAGPSTFGRMVSRSAAGEVVDNGTDQSARMMVLSGFRAFCQNHPQLISIVMPVAGALVGGGWSAWSARGVMLASYHLSRLEYIECVRSRIEHPAQI